MVIRMVQPAIFISHSRKDATWCREFVGGLRQAGCDVWYDEQDLTFGELPDQIANKIIKCPIFIGVLSPDAVTTRWVQREVNGAISLEDEQEKALEKHPDDPRPRRALLFVMAKTCSVPLLWRSITRIEGDDPDTPAIAASVAVGRVLQRLSTWTTQMLADSTQGSPPSPVLPGLPTEPSEEASLPVSTEQRLDSTGSSARDSSSIPEAPVVPDGEGSEEQPVQDTELNDTELNNEELKRQQDIFHRTITDLYDERRGAFLVQYPLWLVGGLALAGMIALALTGYSSISSPDQSPLVQSIVGHPWPLYIWFCALVFILQASILRHRSLRSQLFWVLLVTGISAAAVATVAYSGSLLSSLAHAVGSGILSSPWTYAILNFGLLLLFVWWSVRRVMRIRESLPWALTIDSELNDTEEEDRSVERESDDSYRAILQTLSGDFIIGCLLAGVLALAFRDESIDFFLNMLGTHSTVSACLVKWPFGTCLPSRVSNSATPSLAMIDLVISLVCLYHGVLMEVLTTLVSPERAGRALLAVPRHVLVDALRTLSALRREMQLPSILIPLRSVVWPSLLLTATALLAVSALGIQTYLAGSARSCTSILCAQAFTLQSAAYLGGAVLALVLAFVAVALSAGLSLVALRVVENSLRFLGLVSFIWLNVFWLVGILLSALNAATLWLRVSERVPFAQPGVGSVISFVVFASTFLVLVWRSRQRPFLTDRPTYLNSNGINLPT
jgi:hypothetical protein